MGQTVDWEAADTSFNQVFDDWSGFAFPFSSGIEAATVFYPTDLILTGDHYRAVLLAAEQAGDLDVFVSVVEGFEGSFATYDPGTDIELELCDYSDRESYVSTRKYGLHTATWSETGSWGVLANHEDLSWVGGTESFVRSVHLNYPGWRSDRAHCLRDYREWSVQLPNLDRLFCRLVE